MLSRIIVQMNRAIFGSIMMFSRWICMIPQNKGLTWLRRIYSSLRSCWLLRFLGSCTSLFWICLFLLILLFFELQSYLFRGFLKLFFFFIWIIIKFSFGTICCIFWLFSLLLLNFWRFFFGSRFFSFLVCRLRFLFLYGLLLITCFTLLFRLCVLIASNKFASKPDEEIVNVKPLSALIGLCKHRVWRIRHLRSNFCSIVVISCSTLRELSVRTHIHLIIKRPLWW